MPVEPLAGSIVQHLAGLEGDRRDAAGDRDFTPRQGDNHVRRVRRQGSDLIASGVVRAALARVVVEDPGCLDAGLVGVRQPVAQIGREEAGQGQNHRSATQRDWFGALPSRRVHSVGITQQRILTRGDFMVEIGCRPKPLFCP